MHSKLSAEQRDGLGLKRFRLPGQRLLLCRLWKCCAEAERPIMECVALRHRFILQQCACSAKWRYNKSARGAFLLCARKQTVRSLRASQRAQVSLHSSAQLMQERIADDEPDDEARMEHSIEAESLELLEWPAVCEQVSRFASTPMGRDLCREGRLPFGRNQEESEKLLEQTASALLIASPLDFTGIVNVSAILRSAMAGEVLNVSELCLVKKVLSSCCRVSDDLHNCTLSEPSAGFFCGKPNADSLSASASRDSALAPLFSIMENANFCVPLVQALNLSLDSSSLSILDTASPHLSEIRTFRRENMKTLETLLLETGEKVVSAGGMDSVIVTTRRARLCVAVRASHKHLLAGGVVLDVSNTRATLYMEPKAALELNNKEVELACKEKAEERLILESLTQKLTEFTGDIWLLLEKVTLLDVVFAKAGHCRWLSSVKPTFSIERNLNGKQSELLSKVSDSFWLYVEGLFHPILLGQTLLWREMQVDASFPVPLDFKVKFGVRVIVISGPNTGGKTASMKTLGIAVLMAKAGLFVPAKGKAVLPWFDQVLADIGDSQSLEQSLSTFSGHIRRACRIMEGASHMSLVLFDEIGSGTDPSEGAALATAILERMADHSRLTIATTHFSKLSKIGDLRFEVASVEFDIETLQPKYKILWGVAGQSYALDIASSLGVDEDVLMRARHWMRMLAQENEKERVTQLMHPLIQQKRLLKSQAEAAALLVLDAKKLHDELEAEADSLQMRIAALRLQREDRVKREVNAAKSHMEKIILDYEISLKDVGKSDNSMSMGDALGAIVSVIDNHIKPLGPSIKQSVRLEAADRPSIGDSVLIRRLGKVPATVLEGPADDDQSFLVQLGGLKIRAKLGEVTKVLKSEERQQPGAQRMNKNAFAETPVEPTKNKWNGPAFQTSRNSVDLRGMRVDEALMNLDFAFLRHQQSAVFFVIHGEGTGALRAAVLQRLKGHPMVLKFEQESPMNYGCTAVYLK